MVYEELHKDILAKRLNPVKAIAVSFLVVILIGTALLMAPFSSRENKPTSIVDALFTATSAMTVTGLVVKDTHDYYSTIGQIIILVLIQIGGLGYMTLMSFLFIFGRNLKLEGGIYLQESMNLPSISEVYKFARNTAFFVFVFELLGALTLYLMWHASMGSEAAAKYGIFHSISAFNNSGFDLFGGFNSLTGQATNVGVAATIMLLTLLGGSGFIVINELIYKATGRHRRLSLHTRLVLGMSMMLLVIGTAAFFLLENNQPALKDFSLTDKVLNSAFHSVNARSSGFNSVPIGSLQTATLMLLIILMFIGSSPGGTGGGVKTNTAAVALRALISFAKGKSDIEIFDRRVGADTVLKSFAIIGSAALLIIIASVALSLIEPVAFEKLLFETTSAFGTVGLSTGITPHLAAVSKLILVAVMFIGRVGPLALLHLLLRMKSSSRVRLPQEDVMVG